MIFAMSCISLLGSIVWGHHMYTIGLETDTRAYFTGITILISLPTGTKIFNWLSTYLGNLLLLYFKISSALFNILFLLMFTIGGSTGIILGNAAIDIGLHDTYYVIAHFHFILSLFSELIIGNCFLPFSFSLIFLYLYWQLSVQLLSELYFILISYVLLRDIGTAIYFHNLKSYIYFFRIYIYLESYL